MSGLPAQSDGEWFECEGAVWWWPRCHIKGCPNFICMGRSDRFCWPHSSSDMTLAQILAKGKRKKRAKQPA